MVIATVNNAEYDTSVLQQSGRLMEVVKFKIPTPDERIDVIITFLTLYNVEICLNECLNNLLYYFFLKLVPKKKNELVFKNNI